MFFTNIAADNPYRPWLDYVLNWRLIERSAGELRELVAAAGIDQRGMRLERDRTGLTHLVELWADLRAR